MDYLSGTSGTPTPRRRQGHQHPDPTLPKREGGETSNATLGRPSCNTSFPVPHLPPPLDELIEVPPSPNGIFDTLKIVLRHSCAQEDLDALLASSGWDVKERAGGIDTTSSGATRPVGSFTLLSRKRDGCRVRLFNGKIEVEVSLPRALGLPQDAQHLMTEADGVRALEMVTSGLFPATTRRARLLTPDLLWYITRLDLAANFRASVGDLCKAYRDAQRPRSSAHVETYGELSTVETKTGFAMYGKSVDLLIYDPAQRPQKGKLRALLRGRQWSKRKGTARFEFRFKTTEVLARMLNHFEVGEDGLPFLVPCADGIERVVRFGLDHHRLHQVLATQAHLLGHGTVIRASLRKGKAVLRYLGLLFLIEHPELLAEIERGGELSKRTIRTIKQELTHLRIEDLDANLVQLAWGRPRVRSSLQQKLIRQTWRMGSTDRQELRPFLDALLSQVCSEAS